MWVLKNTCRGFFLLLTLVNGSSPLYSTDCSQFFSPVTGGAKAAENGLGKQSVYVENEQVNKAGVRICKKRKPLVYYLYVTDFASSFIEIPTSNVSGDSSTISSRYLAGRAPIYNAQGLKVGTCSASFLCMQNADGIYTDISNYLSADNGLVISWFTPTTLINLELDSIIHSMVTQCLVMASTKIGFNPFYGKVFNMIVSSDSEKVYFNLYPM